ncbi:MAG: ATP-binding cassette domain-containing protein [Deltaproteobacteria bacterium]|nr:ATP-binding cassette domain-containing protein [Deltaproteobacteria bacterium]
MSKHFGGLIAVNQVNFHIQQNETVGIIGPNGSGKTTFFNLVSGLFPPTAGRIVFFGNDITDLPPNQRVMQGMVRTFQLVSVFNSMTVWENLVLSSIRFQKEHSTNWKFLLSPANKEIIIKNCFEAMRVVGLESKALTLTSELSYGFKRMLEIGIALSLNPKLLLLDEPLSGLSDLEIIGVLDILQRIKKNLTLVIIEHKVSKIVNLVNHLRVMNEGKFICEGKPDRVLSDRAVRECYWGKGEVAEFPA